MDEWDAEEGSVGQEGSITDKADYTGFVTEWKPPTGNGPARFKMGNLTLQVWPTDQGGDENPAYLVAKKLAFDGGYGVVALHATL